MQMSAGPGLQQGDPCGLGPVSFCEKKMDAHAFKVGHIMSER
jgi:hypothetical protein